MGDGVMEKSGKWSLTETEEEQPTGSITKEIMRDFATNFMCEIYNSDGYFMHFHRNMEIYGVIKGKSNVIIDGESQILTDGQIAVINGLESHSYEVDGKAEVFFVLIGTEYLRPLHRVTNGKKLKRWLLDAQYNQRIFDMIREVDGIDFSELRKYSYASRIFADIVEHYGVEQEKGFRPDPDDMMVEIIQYIYDHYKENLNLKVLADHFGISPAAFSHKFNSYVKTDLRSFINDIRVQRVVQMIENKENQGRPIMEMAQECGFVSQMTFYRSYKRNFKFYKSTPGEL